MFIGKVWIAHQPFIDGILIKKYLTDMPVIAHGNELQLGQLVNLALGQPGVGHQIVHVHSLFVIGQKPFYFIEYCYHILLFFHYSFFWSWRIGKRPNTCLYKANICEPMQMKNRETWIALCFPYLFLNRVFVPQLLGESQCQGHPFTQVVIVPILGLLRPFGITGNKGAVIDLSMFKGELAL